MMYLLFCMLLLEINYYYYYDDDDDNHDEDDDDDDDDGDDDVHDGDDDDGDDDDHNDAHHHVVSGKALIHRTARPSISVMSSLVGLSLKCWQLVITWPRSQARNQRGFGGFVRTPLFANPHSKNTNPPPQTFQLHIWHRIKIMPVGPFLV